MLAPARTLQEADPLPHSWEVTSDSIAAWVAGQVGAPRLILIKPRGVGVHSSEAGGRDRPPPDGLVDPYFARALPAGVGWSIAPVDQVESWFRGL